MSSTALVQQQAFLAEQDVVQAAVDNSIAKLRPHVICKDGFNVSLQASRYHYCHPRVDNAERYETIEVGFPSEACPELMPYADDPEHPTGSIYAGVPVEVVAQVLLRHGGVDLEAMFAETPKHLLR